VIAALRRRWEDYRRECRIRALVDEYVVLLNHRRVEPQRDVWARLKAEIQSRSPDQIERMERRFR
jgi:hypothetical protein